MRRSEVPPLGHRRASVPERMSFAAYGLAAKWQGQRFLDEFSFEGEDLGEVTLSHGLRWSSQPWLGVTTYNPASFRSENADSLGVNFLRDQIERELGDQEVYRLRGSLSRSEGADVAQVVLDGHPVSAEVVRKESVAGCSFRAPTGSLVVMTWTGTWLREYENLVAYVALDAYLRDRDSELARRQSVYESSH